MSLPNLGSRLAKKSSAPVNGRSRPGLIFALMLFILLLPTLASAQVYAWGYNGDGETDVPSGLTGVIAIGGGNLHSLSLKSDGTVVAWGDNGSGQCTIPSGLSGVTAISAGKLHSLALKSDGTVVAWGLNTSGQSTVPGGLTGVTAIRGGNLHSLALKSDGTVVAWGGVTQVANLTSPAVSQD